ncbi:MAG: Zn-ribbon domain-containing OB-fold protein [Nitrososphaerota archaeon]|jgi:uncharacterized OB-fold protein|nr:Zn-ribbon domain-containing OB-fold protein [Nitrososphaerota archaeon]
MSSESISRIATSMIEASLRVPKSYKKALPVVMPLAKQFWEAATKHELVLQKCSKCSTYQWFPKPWCINCGCRELNWTKVSGRGQVYSYVVIRQVVQNTSAFDEDLPYVLATIELDEGPRMVAQLTGVVPEEVKIGMNVIVTFVDATSEVSIPKFKRA